MKKLKLLSLILAFVMIAAACADDDPQTTTQDPDDTASDLRIVSLSPTPTETLFAIGAGDMIIGLDQFSNFPAETADVETTGLDSWNINVEAIADLDPDLIFMQSGDAADEFRALGIDVIENDAATTFEGVYAQIEEVGDAVDHSDEATALIDEMQTDIAELIDGLADVTGATYYHELGTDYFSATSATFIGEVYGLFGLVNIADAVDADGSVYPQLSEEYIIDSDPDFIFLADTLWANQTTETVAERPGWEGIAAVENGGVVELNDDIVSRWGPRVVDFIEVVAAGIENAA